MSIKGFMDQNGQVQKYDYTALENIPENLVDDSDLAAVVAGQDDLKNDIAETNSKVFKNVATSGAAAISLAAGAGINATVPVLNFRVPANTQYKYTVEFSGASDIAAVYQTDVNGTRKAIWYSPVSGRTYTDTSADEIAFFSFYIDGSAVPSDASVKITVSYTATNEQSLEAKIELAAASNADAVGESELIDRAVVLVREKRIEVGANVNNDNNATYIYHRIVPVKAVNGSVSIKVSDITNARYVTPIVARFLNGSGTLVKEYDIEVSIAQKGITLIPPDNATTYDVRLYPSVDGGLTDVTAVYSNLVIIETPYASNYFNWLSDNNPNVPYYYLQNNYLSNKVDSIRYRMGLANGNYDCFFFCTDQHWTLNRKQSPALMRYLSQKLNIPRAFMGGDYADGISLDAINAYKTAYAGKIYNVTGNHEYMDYFTDEGSMSGKTISGGLTWAYLDGGMTDAIIGSGAYNYYYVDNPTQKMRYIILNVFTDGSVEAFDSAQQTWLANVALNLPTGFTAVIFAHMCSSVDHETGAVTPSTIGSAIYSIVDSSNAEIAAIVQGHTHFDGLGRTPGGVPVFITTCDKYLPVEGADPFLSEIRHPFTITEQAFDVFIIDKTNRNVWAVRIGCPANNPSGDPLEVRELTY